jgi:hypothetical protein
MVTDSQHTNGHLSNGCVPNGTTHGKQEKACPRPQSAWQYTTFKKLFVLIFLIPLFITYYLSLSVLWYPVLIVLAIVPSVSVYLGVNNFLYVLMKHGRQESKVDKYIEFVDEEAKAAHAGKFMPIRDLYELYCDGKIEFKGDVLECLERRNEYVSYKLQWWHLKFLLQKLVPELLHGKNQDQEQVCDHYNRGNDFYANFLGPMMIYTSGIRVTENDTLEEMQENKLKKVFDKILLKNTDKHLDIGCGWGTLCNAAAEQRGANSTGVSIAKEQVRRSYNSLVFICWTGDNFICF